MNRFLCYKLRRVTLFGYSTRLLPCYGGHGEELLSTSAMRNIPKEANSEAEIKRLRADANQNHIAVTSHPFGMVIVKNKTKKTESNNCWRGCGETPCPAGGNVLCAAAVANR